MNPDVIRGLHRTSGTIAAILGILANCVLLWMIAKSQTKAFRKILLQMAAIDIIFVVLTAIAEPIVIFIEGSEFVVQNGFFRRMPHPFNGLLIDIWLFGLYFSISSICVQFFYRYLILCRQMQPSSLKFMGLLSISFTASLGISVIFHFGYAVGEGDEEFATQSLRDYVLENGEKKVYVSSISRKGNPFLMPLASYALLIILINYIIIIFCIFKIRSTLQKSRSLMSTSTRQLHNQLSWTLGLQAGLPLVVSCGPLSFLCYTIITQGTAFWSMIWMTTGFSWIPFLNAMSTLMIVREFRQKLIVYTKINASSSYITSIA